ncbi:hypothetical protein OVA11_19485 [Caulobacter sp. SL161]|uniref:RHS repeat domain-containing protein n=1 Tax=Caulobacter sp. SL161 TaxID=2995156 RepID=UPI0022745834|nr:RHS repeat-associated core domain-containing protein [Caulobacter sp. SL161]MCY1649161.1 hypothetical protein [Caulobacter sp. SL161]
MVFQVGRFAQGVIQLARKGVLLLALISLASLGIASIACAQSAPKAPKYSLVDANGVNLIDGDLAYDQIVNSIGPDGAGSLREVRTLLKDGRSRSSMFSFVELMPYGEADTLDLGFLNQPGGFSALKETTVTFMGRMEKFAGEPFTGTSAADDEPTPSTLVDDGVSIVYTLNDGTVARFERVVLAGPYPMPVYGKLQSVAYPTGETLTFTYGAGTAWFPSWIRVESSLGYAMAGPYNFSTGEWSATAVNLIDGACSNGACTGPTFASAQALGKSATSTLPSGNTITTAAGVVRTYGFTGTTDEHGTTTVRVGSVTYAGQTWQYSYSIAYDPPDAPWVLERKPYKKDGILTVTATDPLGRTRIVKSRMSTQKVLSDTDAYGKTTNFQYNGDGNKPGSGNLNRITFPEGNSVSWTMDERQNVLELWNNPKPNSGLSATVVRARYPLQCVNPKTCNQPEWVEDARGNRTDFTYAPTHGGLLTVTRPAGPNGVRPQTRYVYMQVSATYIKDGAAVSGAPAWRLQSTSSCRTGSSCAGTADELVTEYTYESGTSVNHNARLISVTTRAGNATASSGPYSTTTYAYNARGDVIETDGPLAGNGDIVQTRYDASRWVIGTVGQAVTISSATKYRASKITYRADGQVQLVQTGVVADRSDATFANSFVTHSAVATDYDSYGRPVAQESRNASGTAYALTQTNYDSLGRVNCVAQRMAAFTSRPAACSVSTTTPDPDRITQNTYNDNNQLTAIQSGVGVAAFYDRRMTYTDNGKIATDKDGAGADGNVTTYTYDGLDRLKRVTYPSTAKGSGGSNSLDFEEYGYDSAGNITSRRLRADGLIVSTYDNLGRLRTRTTPNADLPGASYTYTYDNFGNLTAVTDGSRTTSRTYDALSRLLWEQDDTLGTASRVSYEYDAAGRRTKLTWPDNFFVTYVYDDAGALTAVRRAGSTSSANKIASFAYDALGRRTAVSRGNNKVRTSYAYNPTNLLLQSMTHTPTSAGDGVQFNFTYNAASQIKQRTISNSTYAWNGAYVVDRPYETDGLNRVLDAGTSGQSGYTVYGYDGRGNLVCAATANPACTNPTVRYTYDSENRLRGTTAGASLIYDPMGRLFTSTTVGGTTTRYLYDGVHVIGEYNNSSTLQRRYVFGGGADEVLARYTGAGTTPDYLLADHQGSIIAAADSNGAVTTKLTYDEYGAPGPGNVGLFQYTGQVYLSDLSLYHYKARAYSPTLGRFLQTDPIGYDDGLNWYAYVGNDPLNFFDPSGAQRLTLPAVENLVLARSSLYRKMDTSLNDGRAAVPTSFFSAAAKVTGLGNLGGATISSAIADFPYDIRSMRILNDIGSRLYKFMASM